jgi:pyruvate-formate lyase-activating enzyme
MSRLAEPIPFVLSELASIAAIRPVSIWGAGNQGRGIATVLKKNKIPVSSFIDSSKQLYGTSPIGIPVKSPDDVKFNNNEKTFIIIAAFFYSEEIETILQRNGLTESVDYIHYSRLKNHDYAVDVSGTCNLRCIACPRAEKGRGERIQGFMTLDTFKKVIDKINREDPFVGNIQLYQWGEPPLNKDLPAMIRYARSRGITCAISSNLNAVIDYRAVIEAKPEWFRVSVSGTESRYEVTHTGGKWQRFKENLQTLGVLRKEIYPEMKVELYYHIYRHTGIDDLAECRTLCETYNFEFHPVYAYLISLDDVLAYREGQKLPKAAKAAADLMLFDLDEGLKIAQKESKKPCDTFRCIHINWDLTVSNCMMYYYPENNNDAGNYLEIPIEKIQRIRQNSSLCRRCLSKGMHRYCAVFSTLAPSVGVEQ